MSAPTRDELQGAPTRDELLGLTVPALKERCRQSGRPCSGRKGELVDALLRPAPGASPRKRPAAGAAAGAAPPKRATPGPGGRDEAARHFAALSRRAPSRKEIESTEPGGAPTVVERTLPSFFDYYPRARRAHDALAGDGPARLALLRACARVVETGDAAAMGALVAAALPPDAGDAAAPIDVDAGAGAPPAAFRWQVDGGDAGWLDFDAASNAAAEDARRRGAGSAAFTSPYGSYDLNLEFMVQINRATGTARPVRYVP